MEFILEKEINEIVPKAVDFNFNQLKQELEVKLKNYQNLVVTEDSTKEAKADRAKLNALKKSIDAKRSEIKKEWNVPYIVLEDKVKILLAMINEPIVTIDTQVKAYEQKIKDEKAAVIEAYFNETIGDLKALVPYSKLYDPKWMNAGEKLPAIKQIIELIIQSINADLKIIRDLELECEQQMIDKYLVNLNMSEALAEKVRFEQQVLKMAEYTRQQEIKKKQEEARQQALEDAKARAVDAEIEDVEPVVEVISQGDYTGVLPASEPPQEPELEELIFKVKVTPAQKAALRRFFVENKIMVGRA